ncbi:MAG: enolase [Candidatus Lokiarchaeota archaeon]
MMTDYKITKIKSRWILDSRGNPTVESDVYCGDKFARAAVPSGASTGVLEALELRDGGDKFMGKHVTKAVKNVNDVIAKNLKGYDVREQRKIDNAMIQLDGTENKSKLGANAILSVSLGAAKLAAKLEQVPLFSHLYNLSHEKNTEQYLLPIPSCNIINGGEHAGNDLAVQEFMILPIGAENFSQGIRYVSEVYHTLKQILSEKYGKTAINVGDEGGFAPNISHTKEALDLIIRAIEERGFTLGNEFILGMDAAASEFYENGKYTIDGKELSEDELLQYYLDLIKEYQPLKSIEDPFDEKSFDAFSEITKKIDSSMQVLLKVNQIGSLSEAIDAANLAFKNEFNVMVSHRSGETEDPFIADLAVGLCTGQIKSGAPARSERTAKYNQLLRIEEVLGEKAHYPDSLNSWRKFQ